LKPILPRRTNELADPDALRAQVLSEMTLNALDITLRQIEKSQEMKGKSLSRIASWRRRALAISTAPAKPYPLEEEERWIGLEAAQSGSGFR